MSGHKRSWDQHPILNAAGEDKVMELRASGLSVRLVAQALGVTPRALYHWFDKGEGWDVPNEHGATRRERWARACKLCAEAIADGATSKFAMLRDPNTGRMRLDVSREEIAFTTAETNHDKWLASKMDPETYGDKSAGTTVTIGTLHLNAVKAVLERTRKGALVAQTGEAVPIEDADFTEMLTEGGADDDVHAG